MFRHFVTRKLALYNNTRAIVCFPGGFGTLDELFEVWHWAQIKGINLVLVGKDYWQPIFDVFEQSWKQLGLEQENGGEFRPHLVDDPKEAIDFIATKKVYDPITSDKHDQRAVREIKHALNYTKKWPAACTVIGAMNGNEEELGTLRQIAIKMHERGMPLRIATKNIAVNAAIYGALDEEAWRKNVFAITHRQTESSMTHSLERLDRHYSSWDMANYHVLLTENSNGFIFLPGGIKTMSRLFDLLTVIQTGIVPPRPIVLIGRKFWMPILEVAMKQMKSFEPWLISPEDTSLFVVTDSADEALEALSRIPEQRYKNKLTQPAAKKASDSGPSGARLAITKGQRGLTPLTLSIKRALVERRTCLIIYIFFPAGSGRND